MSPKKKDSGSLERGDTNSLSPSKKNQTSTIRLLENHNKEIGGFTPQALGLVPSKPPKASSKKPETPNLEH
jgi:hypothetical protein